MAKNFITSDLHWGHHNIIKFCPNTRKYNDSSHMNEMLIKNWNETISSEDNVYFLGDFSFMNKEKTLEIVNRLQFNKMYFVKGNHDTKEIVQTLKYANRNIWFHDYLEIFSKKHNKKVVMFHFPIEEWNGGHHKSKSIHLHGHSHGNSDSKTNRLDVGWDAHGKFLELDEAIDLAIKQPNKPSQFRNREQ